MLRQGKEPTTLAEAKSGYTYIPVDPFPIYVEESEDVVTKVKTDQIAGESVLDLLPDHAVRMSVERLDASLKGSHGPVGVGTKGGVYRVTVDYINADTTNIRVWIEKTMETYHKDPSKRKRESVNIYYKNKGKYVTTQVLNKS